MLKDKPAAIKARRCYETAIEQIINRPVPDFRVWHDLICWLDKVGWTIELYECNLPLYQLGFSDYAIVTQRLKDKSLHASLTYCGQLDKNNSGLGRQFATKNDVVELITLIKPKVNHVEAT